MVIITGETPMLPQRLVMVLQLLGAALGIPAAAAGCYSAYQTYFSTGAVCQRLRTVIVITLESKISSDAKQALLRRNVAEFDKTCGDSDPDASTVFKAALQEHPPSSPVPDAGVQIATADTQSLTATPSLSVPPAPVLGAAGSGERYGWIALSRQQAGAWISNFGGYAISETSLLPLGTVLIAQRELPVWTEPQLAGSNDPTKLQNMLPARACVRVLATLPGIGRLWAQVAPASCNGWVALGRRQAGAWVVNFHGYAISERSLPPAGTILIAQQQLPVWSEPQLADSNDQTKLQNILPARACVRVLASRPGAGRLWAEVAPTSCS